MRVLLAVVFIVIFIVPAVAIEDKIADRLWESSKVVDELIQAPDSEVPKPLLKRAECVAVIPGLKKAALEASAGSLAVEPSRVRRMRATAHSDLRP